MGSRRRFVTRLVLLSAVVGGLLAAAGAAGAIPGFPPIALARISSEPGMTIGPPGATPLTVTVSNLTPLSGIAAVEVRRPSSQWVIGSCAVDPPLPGWSASAAAGSCRFTSAASPADDLTMPPLRSFDNFKVYAGTLPRATDLTGTWIVRVSSTHNLSASSTRNAFPSGINAFEVRAHTFEVTDIRVGSSAQTPGSACPSFDHSADPGSTVALVICGTNHATATITPGFNVLTGSFVVSPGVYAGGPVPAGATGVVLGNRTGAVVTPLEGENYDLSTRVIASPDRTSPLTTFTGYRATYNEPPVAAGDAYSTDEDVLLTVAAPGVLGNDTDVDGDALSAVLVSGPTQGSLTLNDDGSFTYQPDADFNGPDSFTYKANDGDEDSNVATVSLTVNPVNDPPVASDDAYTTPEDETLVVSAAGVLSNDSDPEGAGLTAAVVASPANGALTLNADGSFTYVPNSDFNGTDSFTYMANDGSANSNVATVNLTVDPVNDAPVATGDAYSTDEDVLLSVAVPGVLGNDSDIDGDPLAAILVAGPANGTLTWNEDGSFAYQPVANYNGPDSFTYAASDGTTASSPVTVTLTVGPVNDPPVATDDAYATTEDAALVIVLPGVLSNDSDPESNALTAAVVASPSNGTLTLNADGSFTYAPDADFNGADSFTYKANDGSADSNVATVNLTIDPANDPPIATGDAYTANEDVELIVAAPGVLSNDTDVDGDSLTAVLVTGPVDGLLTLNADGSFSYVPDAEFSGSDSFTYKTNDGSADSGIATVTLTVDPVNDPPVATDDSATTSQDTPLTVGPPGVLANDSDIDGGPLTAQPGTGPDNGTLTLNSDGSYTYTPGAGFSGTTSFTYTAFDGAASSNVATVTITVSPNSPPVANDDAHSVDEDGSLSVLAPGVLGNDTDADADSLTAVQVSGPSNGSLTLNADGSFTYQPNGDFNGADSFTYKANDGTVDSAVATVSITVNAVNDAPVNVVPGTQTIDEDASIVFSTANGNAIATGDVDAGSSAVQVALTATNGTASLSGTGGLTFSTGDGTADPSMVFTGSLTDVNAALQGLSFDPTPGFSGSALLSMTVDDQGATGAGGVQSDTDAVAVTVNAVNDGPVNSVPGAQTVAEDTALIFSSGGGNAISVADSDAGAGSIEVTLTATNGTSTLSGTAGLSFSTGDGTGDATMVFTGTVAAINAALDGMAFTGSSNYFGAASLQIDTDDQGNTGSGGALTDSDSIAITVTAVNDPPVATDDSFTGAASALGNTKFHVFPASGTSSHPVVKIENADVQANDTDVDTPSSGFTTTAGATSTNGGTVSMSADGEFVYVPPPGFIGVDTFTYTLHDNDSLGDATDTGTISITVAGPRVWYVDNALGAAGNGTSTAPFNSLAPLSTGGSADTLDGTGDVIFLYQGSGAYGGIVLEGSQRLAGQPQGLTVTDTQSRTHNLVAAGGTTPQINNGAGDAITVATGNVIQAVAVTGANGSAISGAGVNTLTVAANVTLAGATGGGSTDAELYLDGGNGTVTIDAPITGGAAGRAIVIKNRTGGTTTVSAGVSSTAGGQGILLDNNDGATVTLSGAVTLSTTTNPGFSATNGGTVVMPGTTNTVATTTGVPVTITNTTIGSGGVRFQSVSANGAANGIVLANAGSGGFTVTGTGTTDGSGGTIQNITNRGVSAVTTDFLSLANMTFNNAGSVNAGDVVNCGTGALNTACNAAIHLEDVGGATLSNTDITDGAEQGINGNDVNNFALANSVISSVGDEVNESGIRLVNVLGASSISNSTITGSAEDNLYINNTTGTLTSFNVTGSTFSATTPGSPGNDGILIKPEGTSAMTVSITGSTFTNNRGDHIQVAPAGTAISSVTISGNTMTDNTSTSLGGGITVNPAAGTNTTAVITNNTLTGSVTTAVVANLNTDSTALAILKATVSGNSIGTNGAAGSGSEQGHGISVVGNGAGTVTSLISNNAVHGFTNAYGIYVLSRDGSGTVNATVTGNTVGTPDPVLALDAIRVEAGTTATDAGTVCADIGGGTAALRNQVTTGANEAGGGNDIRLRVRFGAKIRLPGYAGGATDVAAVGTYLAGRNDTTTTLASTSSTDPAPYANATCATP